ncbi:MAG: GWxTD domain-containing protein [Bacteroidota bacterium]
MKRSLILIGSILIGAASVAQTQQLQPSSPFVLNVDYARFRNDDSSGYLEVYYGFYPKLITYDFVGGKYVGGVRLFMRLLNAETKQIVREERSLLPVSVKDTTDASLRYTLTSQAGYALPYGDYTLQVTAEDSLTPVRRDSIKLTIEIRPYASTPAMSDIEACSNLKSSDQKSDPFYKNSLEVVPNPTLVFGVTGHPVLFSYTELYGLEPDHTYTLKSQVVDAGGKVMKESTKQRNYGLRNTVEAGTMNVTSIVSGKYRFRLQIVGDGEQELARTEKTFFIYNPHVKATLPAGGTIKSSELAGLSADELEDEFRKAQYVATDQEIKTFSQIKNTEGRAEFLTKFWADVEAGRFGKPPISRVEYLQRVAVANQRYRVASREGWRTDRGRVYTLYAEPDEIQRFPSSENNKPYEVWRCYGIEGGVEFVFIDRTGFGEFVLVHSTKRGELRDDGWQRFLQ